MPLSEKVFVQCERSYVTVLSGPSKGGFYVDAARVLDELCTFVKWAQPNFKLAVAGWEYVNGRG